MTLGSEDLPILESLFISALKEGYIRLDAVRVSINPDVMKFSLQVNILGTWYTLISALAEPKNTS